MLDRLLQIIGVDLEAQFARASAYASAYKESLRRDIRAELAYAGAVAGFALIAFLALAATCVIALIALYTWLEPIVGMLVALLIVGGITGAFGIAMVALAATRKVPPAVAIPEVVVTTTPRLVVPTSPSLTAMAPLPADASLADVAAHCMSSRAADVADEVIDAAEGAIAHGSRMQLVGTLAAAIAVGWIVGRRGGL